MSTEFDEVILAMVEADGGHGTSMGELVDALVRDGATEQEAELAVWSLMQRRELTPHGFRCRTLRKHGQPVRTYEFLLVRWSADRDRQLDLELERK